MELPVEIIGLILAHMSHRDLCRVRRTSQSWRAIATDLLHRGAFKRKTLEERVEFLFVKLQKQTKKKTKKDKRLKEYSKEMLLYALDTTKILELGQNPSFSNEKLSTALLTLFIYAEDEIGLWDYFDEVIARSEDRFISRSLLMTPYSKLICHDLYTLNLDLLDKALDTNSNLKIEVDPSKAGDPENASNLVKVFKQYFNTLLPAIRNMNKSMLGWLQHIYKKFGNFKPIILILGHHFITSSIFIQYKERNSALKKQKTQQEISHRMRQYYLLAKIFASALLGEKHQEDFFRGTNEHTLQVAAQLKDVINELMTVDVDPGALFHPVDFSIDEIFDALTVVKEHHDMSMRKNNNK